MTLDGVGVYSMKISLSFLIVILSVIVLSSCDTKSIDYTNEELFPSPKVTSLSVKDGLYLSDLFEQGYEYGVYESDVISKDNHEFIYKRMFFMNHKFSGQIMFFCKLITDYYEDIINRFNDINEIVYIIVNKELDIVSFLPSETVAYTSNNTLIIHLDDYINEYYSTGDLEIRLDDFYHLHGINFRDFVVSYMNATNDKFVFNNLFSLFFNMIINNSDLEYLSYIDIKIDLETNKPALISELLFDIPIIRTDNSYEAIEGIPIDIIQDFSNLTNDSDEKVKDDIIISSESDCYVDFYYMNDI